MFDQIHKPRLLKDVPLILIRAIPSIYYYVNNENGNAPEKINELFYGNLNFLSDSLSVIGRRLKISEFENIASDFKALKEKSNNRITDLNEITTRLAASCSTYRDQIRTLLREIKSSLTNSYKENVNPLEILIVKNDANPDSLEKLANILHNFCYYNTELINWQAANSTASIMASDFVIFGSTQSSEIHEQAESINSYRKPALAAAFLKKDVVQSLRHGAQLTKRGFPVLYKVFTPIRLFTSIDKIYIMYHLHYN